MSLLSTMQEPTHSFVSTAKINKESSSKKLNTIIVVSKKTDEKKLKNELLDWQYSQLQESCDLVYGLATPQGQLQIVRLWLGDSVVKSKSDLNTHSHYSLSRDLCGTAFGQLKNTKILQLNLIGLNADQTHGALVGLEIASYKFKNLPTRKKQLPDLYVKSSKKLTTKQLDKSARLGSSVNLARHLVNLPPNILNPKTYSSMAQKLFKNSKTVKVNVWNEDRLKKENMGLLLSVGAASETPPCLVHLKYRPKGAKGAPQAFVGKGITFDTGGLNIKTGNYMRLMKKDMGGSASVISLCYWAEQTGLKKNLDFYLALAENSVSDEAVRPSDIMTSRSGLTVEMDNTDAEGRLAMADAFDVAVTAKDKPSRLINVATLTGATRVAVGLDIGGLYSNNQKLAQKITQCSFQVGDPMWPLPLMQKYKKQLKSNVADVANSSAGPGGGIRAALFLEHFVKGVDWAHLDVHAWKMSPEGAYLEAGGSGQAVQCLAEYLD